MRWEQLVDELEAASDAEDRREIDGEVADRTRRELARLHLVDRLRAATGSDVTIGVAAQDPVRGGIQRVGPDWLLLQSAIASGYERAAETELLVVASAITWISGLTPGAVDPAAVSAVDQRLGLGHVLRAAARDRRTVAISLRDGGDVTGIVQRVGADFADLGLEPDRRRRSDRGGGAERTVPFAAMAVVRLA
jgi:hypothetical protein